MTIQWYPGHMAKARRELAEKITLIDIVLELLDARLPYSSRNPMLDQVLRSKPRVILLNKADLADPAVTKEWLNHYEQLGIKALAIDAQSGRGIQSIPSICQNMIKVAKVNKRGLRRLRSTRALIVGIPNVGKSSLINRLAKRQAVKIGNRPGVTKAQQWIKAGEGLELLDTPGILWPKFDNPLTGMKLAASGAIKDEILPIEEVAHFALNFLVKNYPESFQARYGLPPSAGVESQLLELIGKKRGCLRSGGEIDLERTSELILADLRSGKLGPISFERPHDFEQLLDSESESRKQEYK